MKNSFRQQALSVFAILMCFASFGSVSANTTYNCLLEGNPCSGHGYCTIQGLCLCNTYYFGIDCSGVQNQNDRIDTINDGITSGQLAGIVLGWLIGIPVLYVLGLCGIYYMYQPKQQKRQVVANQIPFHNDAERQQQQPNIRNDIYIPQAQQINQINQEQSLAANKQNTLNEQEKDESESSANSEVQDNLYIYDYKRNMQLTAQMIQYCKFQLQQPEKKIKQIRVSVKTAQPDYIQQPFYFLGVQNDERSPPSYEQLKQKNEKQEYVCQESKIINACIPQFTNIILAVQGSNFQKNSMIGAKIYVDYVV